MNRKLKLISFDLCPYVQRARIVLNETGLDHEVEYIDLKNKPDYFAQLSPTGKVPVLSTQDGVIFESSVICEYLNEIGKGNLLPDAPFLRATHRSWIEFGSAMLGKISQLYNAKSEVDFEMIRKSLQADLARVTSSVQGPFYNGEKFRMIDAVYATIFRYFKVFESRYAVKIVESGIENLDWFKKIMERESVQKSIKGNYYDRLDEFLFSRGSFISTLRFEAT